MLIPLLLPHTNTSPSLVQAAAEAIDTTYQNDCPSLAICFDRKHKKREEYSSDDDDDDDDNEKEDIIEAILAKGRKRLKKDNVFDTATATKENTPSHDSLIFLPDKSPTEPKIFTTKETTTIVPSSPSPEEIIKKIYSAMMCENTPSHAGTEDYILSVLTATLKSRHKLLGLDEKRINNMTYCGKVMNLLVILYLNMCGQQDPTISDCQYIPVIHNELVCKRTQMDTTIRYFVAAMNEISFYMYRPELKETFKYSQTRRLGWNAMTEKLMGFDNEMRACGVTTPCGNGFFIMPVYGLKRVKPWSTLSLLGARLYYKHKMDI